MVIQIKGFEFLEHTADVKFKAYGENLEETFENSAKAMFSVMTDLSKLKREREFEFEVSGQNLDSLLYSFLGELIYLRDSEEILFRDFDVEINESEEGYFLRCKGWSSPLKEDVPYTDVKAITYNEMEIKETEKGFQIQAVLDV